MKNIFLIFFLICLSTGCDSKKLSHLEMVSHYYNARNSVDFNKVKPLVNDSITIISGDYVMPYDNDSFYEVFKWDSIFKPSYKIIELQEQNDQIIASVKLNSIRNTFLKNSNMVCDYRISFTDNKISKIEELECKDVNWKVWQKEVKALVSYIHNNHNDLEGFINDMTMKGAKNYLKAIELFEAKNDTISLE